MTYNIINIDLSHSRINEKYSLPGNIIKVINATGDCYIQLDSKIEDPINLAHVNNIKGKFEKFYISNVTLKNQSVKIIISEDFEWDNKINIHKSIPTTPTDPTPPPAEPVPPFLTGFNFRIPITIPHTKVTTNEVNCPIYIRLRQANFNFANAQSNGNDIRFTKDDGQTLLNFERDRHDGVNLKGDYIVKIPSISSTVDTKFFIYYGNPTATDEANPTAVWDANFVGRWSLKENPAGTAPQMKDSTINNNHGTSHGGMTAANSVEGQIGRALDFDGGNDHIDITRTTLLKNTFRGSYTVSLFIKTTNTSTRRIWGFVDGPNSGIHTALLNFPTSGQLSFLGNSAGIESLIFNTINLNNGIFRKLDFIKEGNTLKGYVDGVFDSSKTIIPGTHSPVLNFFIGKTGNWGDGIQQFKGIIDEVQLSNIARSSSWLNLQYKSQNNTLLTFGAEESNI